MIKGAILLVFVLAYLPVTAFMLWLSGKIFQQKKGFGTAFLVVLKLMLILLVPLIVYYATKNPLALF